MKIIEIEFNGDSIFDMGGYVLEVNLKDKSFIVDLTPNEILINFLEQGNDGKTPIKGVDYFTEIDKLELIEGIYINADVEPIVNSEIENLFS